MVISSQTMGRKRSRKADSVYFPETLAEVGK